MHVYDASGKRLQTTYYTRKVALVEPATSTLPGSVTNNTQLYTITSQTDVGNKRYKRYGTSGSWQLDYVFNPVGYLRCYAPGEHYPFYYIKDHIGNVRETYITPIPGEKYCEQRMQYYPSGLPWNQNSGASEQPFKYNGKEFIEMSGLDEYDSEARWYYPAIMRTTTMDPLCEKYYSTSPYAWCGNNLVNYIDPDGKELVINIPIGGERVSYTYKQIGDNEYAFVDKNNNVYTGDWSFVNELSSALSTLLRGATGASLVEYILGSKNVLEIVYSEKNGADKNGRFIQWNPKLTEGGIDENGDSYRPSYIGLGHELAHIADIWMGTYQNTIWASSVSSKGEKLLFKNADKFATFIENMLRKEHDLPLRSYYAKTQNTYNHGDPQTLILINGLHIYFPFENQQSYEFK